MTTTPGEYFSLLPRYGQKALIVVEVSSHTTKMVPVQLNSTKGLKKSYDFTGTIFVACVNSYIARSLARIEIQKRFFRPVISCDVLFAHQSVSTAGFAELSLCRKSILLCHPIYLQQTVLNKPLFEHENSCFRSQNRNKPNSGIFSETNRSRAFLILLQNYQNMKEIN